MHPDVSKSSRNRHPLSCMHLGFQAYSGASKKMDNLDVVQLVAGEASERLTFHRLREGWLVPHS